MTNLDQGRGSSRFLRRRGNGLDHAGKPDEMAARTVDQAAAEIRREADMTSDQPLDQRPDPAPSPAAIAEERALQLIGNITTHAQSELRGLRDQLDDVMRDMAERRDQLADAIRAHAEFAEAAIRHKLIIGEAVAKLRSDFDASRTPLPPVRSI